MDINLSAVNNPLVNVSENPLNHLNWLLPDSPFPMLSQVGSQMMMPQQGDLLNFSPSSEGFAGGIETSLKASRDWSERVAKGADPLIGIIDSGFSAFHPDLNYDNLILGSDRIDNDRNPLSSVASESEHGTSILGIIGATRNNNLGIDGINDRAKIWLSRAIGSGKWADSLIEFVDQAKALGQKNAVINLSFDLTQINPDGSITPRTQLTSAELAALDYARRNQVIIVAAAGNSGLEQMSALGQASRLFDNIITVGAADGYGRANYSNYGQSLDILAPGGTIENPVFSLSTLNSDGITEVSGTSIATAKVTGAISLIWEAKPDLNYGQVLDIIKHSAKDIGKSGWDAESGFGLLDTQTALDLGRRITPTLRDFVSDTGSRSLILETERWYGNDGALASEQASNFFKKVVNKVVDVFNPLAEAEKQLSGWINSGKKEVEKKLGNLTALVRNSGISGLKNEISGYTGRLNGARGQLDNLFNDVFSSPIATLKSNVSGLVRQIPSLPSVDSLLPNVNTLSANLQSSSDKFNKQFAEIGKSVESFVRNFDFQAGDVFSGKTSSIADGYKQIAALDKQILSLGDRLTAEISGILQSSVGLPTRILQPLRATVDSLTSSANRILNQFDLNGLWNTANSRVRGIFNQVNGAISGINNRANGLIDSVTRSIDGAGGNATKAITSLANSILPNWVPSSIRNKFLSGIDDPIAPAIKAAKNLLSNEFTNFARGSWNSIAGQLTSLDRSLSGYVNSAFNTAKNSLPTLTDFNSASSRLNSLETTANSRVSSIIGDLGRRFSPTSVIDAFKNTVQKSYSTLDQKISDGFSKFEATVTDKAKSIWQDTQNVAQQLDKEVLGIEQSLKDIDAILKNPGSIDDITRRRYQDLKNKYESAKAFVNDKLIDPVVKEALGILDKGPNLIALGLKPLSTSSLNLEQLWKEKWSPMIENILGSVDNSYAKLGGAIINVLEGEYTKAWGDLKQSFKSSSLGQIVEAGKLAIKGKWEDAGETVLGAFGFSVDFLKNQSQRFLSSNAVTSTAAQALKTTGISMKTAQAALDGIGGVDKYSDDDQIQAVLNIIGHYNIPIVSYVAKAANLAYDLARAGKDFASNVETGTKRLISGVLSLVKVQNASDWIDAAFSLKDALQAKEVNKDPDPFYVNAMGSVLEAIDVRNGKNWVEGAYDLFNAKGDKSKFAGAAANIIIAAVDIDKNKQQDVKVWATDIWKVIDDPKSSAGFIEQYLQGEAKNRLKTFSGLKDAQVDTLVALVKDVWKENYEDALGKGFELAGFGQQGMALVGAFKKLQEKKYTDAIVQLVGAVDSRGAAQFVQIGDAISKINKTLDFDESKQNALVAILNAVGSNNPNLEKQKAFKAFAQAKA
ncbi:S8/S53 family peptidase [Microcoleus sp. MON1_C1]|uniref:S8/S53 family peptidase n=1 Tax=Microcoleus sp. MON1_C1 TaxID=2818827 RepID=UPI002FD6B0A2